MNLKIAFLFLLSAFANVIFASHFLGADMSYTALGNGKYKITTKVYRDCRGIPLTPLTLSAFAGNNGGNGCGTVSLGSFSLVNISDITNICPNEKKPCDPVNTGGAGVGVEEHVLEKIIDFSIAPLNQWVNNATCCEVTFFSHECCRNGAITTGPAGSEFYITCSIDLCNVNRTLKSTNSSPQWIYKPIVKACCNIPYFGANDAGDSIDNDSITFSLKAPLQSIPNGQVKYSAGFEAKYPLTPLCIPNTTIRCTPTPEADIPKGFFFDTVTGDFVFTPYKCDEVPLLGFKQTEWRKDSATGEWLKIGTTHREIQVWISAGCGNNVPPHIYGKREMNVCAGQEICETIKIGDKAYSSGQTILDTPNIHWYSNIPGAKFVILDSTLREKEIQFCWQTKSSDAADVAYGFSVSANDSHCNPYFNVVANFRVKVIDCNQSEVKAYQKNQERLRVIPNPNLGSFSIDLPHLEMKIGIELMDLSGRILKSFAIENTSKIHIDTGFPPGVYFVKLDMGNKVKILKFAVN